MRSIKDISSFFEFCVNDSKFIVLGKSLHWVINNEAIVTILEDDVTGDIVFSADLNYQFLEIEVFRFVCDLYRYVFLKNKNVAYGSDIEELYKLYLNMA